VGLLLLGPVDNSHRAPRLSAHKRALEADLRQEYAGIARADLQQLPALEAYKSYYSQFRKTYHVQLQLESVVHKGKSLPAVNPLVDACFAAELETHLLTASHDADALAPPVTVDASSGEEVLHMLSGKRKQIKGGDMMMRDAQSVVCTIIYGQDRRTAVSEATKRVLYVTYAPPGVTYEQVEAHHEVLVSNVRLIDPHAKIEHRAIVTAGEKNP
jgi:DNA/RNA-binding domain of Phe-tRNA-synthetase-like protein